MGAACTIAPAFQPGDAAFSTIASIIFDSTPLDGGAVGAGLGFGIGETKTVFGQPSTELFPTGNFSPGLQGPTPAPELTFRFDNLAIDFL